MSEKRIFWHKKRRYSAARTPVCHIFPPVEVMRNDRNSPFLGKESFGATKIGIPRNYTENVVQNVRKLPLFDIKKRRSAVRTPICQIA